MPDGWVFAADMVITYHCNTSRLPLETFRLGEIGGVYVSVHADVSQSNKGH